MIRSKRGQWTVLCIVAGGLGLVLGCGGGSPGKRSTAEAKSRGEEPLEAARQILRKANDAPAFREALQQLNSHLSQDAEANTRLQRVKDDRDRALPPERLRDLFGLTKEDLDYVGAPTFQPLDAHYMVEAFLLRDAARALNVQDLSPLQQADEAFQWVVRQIVLRGEGEGEGKGKGKNDPVPPQFVLVSGQGSPQERALVFLGLLQQLNLDGCIIAIPGESPNRPRFWAAGVLVEDKGHGEVYLFDPRLGLPVPGPGGKGIATLAQIQAQPNLLRQLTVDKESPYDITPDQAQAAGIYLACPLSALAPRMKLLTDLLSGFDRVQLAVDGGTLRNRFKAAARNKVRDWSQRDTPARALRSFVSVEEGGLDRSGRAQRCFMQTVPWATVARNLRDFGLEELPASADQELRQFAFALYAKYAMNPHDDLVRGRLEETTRRLVQSLAILREFDEGQMPEAEFRKEVAMWRERVQQAYLNALRGGGGDQKQPEGLWNEDQHLQVLLATTADERERQKYPKKVLSFLVVRSVASPLQREASYDLALCWQEKAERLAMQRERQPGTSKNDEQAYAWLNVQDWWRKYVGQYPFTPEIVKSRVSRLNDFRNHEEALALWEWLFRDLRAGFHARLLQARGLAKAGKKDAARTLLQSVATDIGVLRKDVPLNKTLGLAVKQAEGLRNIASRTGGPAAAMGQLRSQLDDLVRDLGPGGSFASMRAAAWYRLSRLDH